MVWALSNRDLAMELLIWIRKFLGELARLIGYSLAIVGLVCAVIGVVKAYYNYNPVVGEFLLGKFLAIAGLLIALLGKFLFEDNSSEKKKRND